MVVMPLGISTLVNLEQRENANLFITLTVLGNVYTPVLVIGQHIISVCVLSYKELLYTEYWLLLLSTTNVVNL